MTPAHGQRFRRDSELGGRDEQLDVVRPTVRPRATVQGARGRRVERLEAASSVSHAASAEESREPREAASELLAQRRLPHDEFGLAMAPVPVKESCAALQSLGDARKRCEVRREVDVQRDDPRAARRVHAVAQRRALAAVHGSAERDESIVLRRARREPLTAAVARSVVDRDAFPAPAERVGRLDERRPARRQHAKLVEDGPYETPVGGGGHRTMEAEGELAFTAALAERATAPGGALVTPGSMIGARKAPPFVRTALATLAALFVALAVIGRAPFDADHVHFAVDTATVQQPWNATLEPRNAELSDQGVAFYPHYRELARRWSAGEWPLWNPRIYLGVPELANPQWGALDPQVGFLGLLDRLGGRELFDRGFAWLAWMRITVALLGAWCLARALGLSRAPAALAALGYGLSGAQVLWLHYPHGHVAPFLPWVLFGIESLAARVLPRHVLLTFGAMLLAILGGQPETAFYVGLVAGLWCLHIGTVDKRAAWTGLLALAAATLCAGPLLAPFLEYLAQSGAWIAHELAASGGMPDWIALGAVLIAVGVCLRLRDLSGGRPAPFLVASIVVGLGYALAERGLGDRAALVFWPDLFGRPQDAIGYGGSASFLETASAWVAFPVLALALAACFGGAARHSRFGLITLLGALALALAFEAPGFVELWRLVPGIGLAAPTRVAPVAALLVSFAAAGALQASPKWARRSAVLACAGCALLATGAGGARPLPVDAVSLDAPIELIRFEDLPQTRVAGGNLRVAGALHPGLPAQSAELRVDRLDERGRPLGAETRIMPLELTRDAHGWNAFDTGQLEVARFAEGEHLFTLRILAEDSDRPLIGERRIARTLVARKRGMTPTSIAFLGATLVILWLPSSTGTAWWLVALVLLQGIWFGRGANPSVSRKQCFPPTRTEAVLAEVLGERRLFAAPGILPANTPLVAGLATLDGYDALDPATFDGYRAAALRSGAHPLLDWNAEGARVEAPAFRLLGVGALLLHENAPPPGWSIVAGPRDAQRLTEVFIAVPDDPLPTAFCVPRVTPRAELVQRSADFDPRAEAFVEDAAHFTLERPFTHSSVEHTAALAELERFRVTLDGDGLFLHSAQHFPGWEVRVDGEARPLLRVNSLFRGVQLAEGEHEVEFRYRPASWRYGWWLAACGVVLLAASWRLTSGGRGGSSSRS